MRHWLVRSLIPGSLLAIIAIVTVFHADLGSYVAYHEGLQVPQVTGEQTYISDVTIYRSPQKEDWIIQKIDAAKSRVFVAIYTFTLPSLREALARARDRGVDVQVILEKNPYNAVTLNRETKAFFREKKIPFHESDESQFAFMHAKYMVIDDAWIIETANWTRASFATNREFFVTGRDPAILASLAGIFREDFLGKRGESTDIRILAGPTNVIERLKGFVATARTSIDVYVPSLSDPDIIASLTERCHAGVTTRILLAYYDDAKYPDYDRCLQVRLMKKTSLHAKVIMVDRERAFVSSFNYTTNSLTNNREMGIFLTGKPVADPVAMFTLDWQKSLDLAR